MVPQQKLHFFLPRLYFKLLGTGMSKETALSTCDAMRGGALPPTITNLEDYQRCWLICHAMEDLLTTLDDGSAAARWCTELAFGIVKFENAYLEQHGHRPLNPGPPEWTEGPQGYA